ncbi:hypothetical protein FRC06_006083 [Ceratobasidium sp. 370]|nr:hypothetical protein FRC06_006083 [Ceratobasidium sp. 370]
MDIDIDDRESSDAELVPLGFDDDQLKSVDNNLPPLERVSLDAWCSLWERLNTPGNRDSRDALGLTGHFRNPAGQMRRAQLDFSSHRVRERHALDQLCDIDSVIGVVQHQFPILGRAVLKYFMLHSVTHTLDSDLHIPPVSVVDENGYDKASIPNPFLLASLSRSADPPRVLKDVYPHMVPNTRFIEMEPRAIIRVFFPLAPRNPSRTNNCLVEENMRQLYDLAVRPAATETLPHELHFNWPATYDDEKFRAENPGRTGDAGEGRTGGRTLQQSGRDVHAEYLNAWVDRIRELVDGVPDLKWARSLFFVVEMRGMKNREVSIHEPPRHAPVDASPPPPTPPSADGLVDTESPRVQAMDGVLEYFDTDLFQPGCWFLDIATSVTVSDDSDVSPACAFASTRMHAEILSHFLEEDVEQCERWVAGQGGFYQKDEVAHLQGIAGFRFTNPNSDMNGVHYVQVYSSEKSVTYNLDAPNKAKRTSPFKLLKDWDQARKSHFQPLANAFRDSSRTHSVALRIESRVEFYYSLRVHLHIDDDILRGWLYRVDNAVFWGWKVYRLLSIYNVLIQFMSVRHNFTLHQLPECGSLLILLSWMANALVNRPDEGSHWDEVRDSGSVHRIADGRLVPHQPLGAFFLHSLHLKKDRVPRISSQRTVSKDTIIYLFKSVDKSLTEMDVYNLITGNEPLAQDALERDPWGEREGGLETAPAVRYPNKQRVVRIMNTEKTADQFAGIIQEAERDERYSSEDEDDEERERPTLRSQVLTDLVYSYPVQIFAKAPNRKVRAGGEQSEKEVSWCSLNSKQRAEVQFDMFCSKERLEEAFKSYVSFGYDADRWTVTVEILFPTLQEARAKETQGLRTLKVYKQFLELLTTLPPSEQANVVSQARQYVNERWLWLPYGIPKSHLWATGTRNVPKYATTVKQPGQPDGGPWIVLNPARMV